MSDWRNNLIRELNDPSKWIHWSKDAVVVRDRYPKAMYHFLVMPKADIPSIFDVSVVRSFCLLAALHPMVQFASLRQYDAI